jgi:hypothetical protein
MGFDLPPYLPKHDPNTDLTLHMGGLNRGTCRISFLQGTARSRERSRRCEKTLPEELAAAGRNWVGEKWK